MQYAPTYSDNLYYVFYTGKFILYIDDIRSQGCNLKPKKVTDENNEKTVTFVTFVTFSDIEKSVK